MDANFVTINPEIADIVPWRNKTLKTEQLSRATAKMLVVVGVIVALIAFSILVFSFLSVNMIKRDLDAVRAKTEQASLQLVRDASSTMQNDSIKHMVRVQELLDALSRVDGTLVLYDVKKGKVRWEALIPPAFVQLVLERFPVRVDEENTAKDGRVRVVGTR